MLMGTGRPRGGPIFAKRLPPNCCVIKPVSTSTADCAMTEKRRRPTIDMPKSLRLTCSRNGVTGGYETNPQSKCRASLRNWSSSRSNPKAIVREDMEESDRCGDPEHRRGVQTNGDMLIFQTLRERHGTSLQKGYCSDFAWSFKVLDFGTYVSEQVRTFGSNFPKCVRKL